MADSDLIVCPPLQTYFIDKDTAQALSAGVVTFYSQYNPTQLKNIYQQSESPAGEPLYTVLQNPVILTSIGTFGDDSGNDINVFLYPYLGSPSDPVRGAYDPYYIEVASSTGVPQYTRMFYPPNAGVSNSGADVALSSTNQITNSQFVETFFSQPTTFGVSGSNQITAIAPGWFVKTSGTGSVIVSQIALPFSSTTNRTNAPYALQIESVTLDAISLFQRFEADPLLLSGGFVSGFAQIASLNGSGSQSISLQYQPSSGTAINIITQNTRDDETFTTISGTSAIASTNADVAPDGFVDFVIVLPKNIRFQVTSVQLVGATSLDSEPNYLPLSTQLQTSNLYWYDKPALEYKPINSYLVGWDFPYNPAQFLGDSGSVSLGAGKSQYIWDQTIVFQTVASSIGFSRDADTNSLVITPSSSTSFALIQYLDETDARAILSGTMSVQLRAKTSAASLAGSVSIYWTTDATLPDLNASNYLSIVSTITTGVPTAFNGTWTKVPFVGNNNATFTLTSTSQELSFEGFDAVSSAGKTTATFFAIVIAFDTLASLSTMTMDYCSLVAGNIATRPGYQSKDDVLRQCQYYYEKSYDVDIVPGSVSADGEQRSMQSASYAGTMGSSTTINCRGSQFSFNFNSVKRSADPVVTLINPTTGTSDSVYWTLVNNSAIASTASVTASTNWTVGSLGNKAAGYNPANVVGAPSIVQTVQGPNSYIVYHFTADARLGLVV